MKDILITIAIGIMAALIADYLEFKINDIRWWVIVFAIATISQYLYNKYFKK